MIEVTVEVTVGQVQSLLVAAFEGGANYWCRVEGYVTPPKIESRLIEGHECPYVDFPVNGGVVHVSEYEDFDAEMDEQGEGASRLLSDYKHVHTLDQAAVRRGVTLLLASPQGADIIRGEIDGNTGDAFLQYAVLGELRYA